MQRWNETMTGLDVLVIFTNGTAPAYQPSNVRYEHMSKADVANRIKSAFEYASARPEPCKL